MNFPIISSERVDLTSDLKKTPIIQRWTLFIQELLKKALEAVKQPGFPRENFQLDRNNESQLTNKSGFYLFTNIKTGRYYFGESHNLAQRKGEYAYACREASVNKKISGKISQDILMAILEQREQVEDFIFLPLFCMPKFLFQTLKVNPETKEQNRQISDFLRCIEFPILTELLSLNDPLLINKKATSLMEIGNKSGGTPQSGQANKPVQFNNVSFESVSCAASALKLDRKTVRNYLEKSMGSFISDNDWKNWNPAKKVTLTDIERFQNENPEFSQRLKSSARGYNRHP